MTGNDVGGRSPGAQVRRGVKWWVWCGLAFGSIALAACQAGLPSAEPPRETVELSVLTPDAGWGFRVREVRETADEVWVWAEVERRKGPAAQQLTTVTARVDLPAGKARRIFVTGKTWAWPNDEPYEFVARAPDWPDGARPVAPTPRDEAGS